MHITHVVAHPPFREGVGTACYYNARALRELGCEIAVYVPNTDAKLAARSHDGYQYMPCWLSIENAFLSPQILSIGKTDLIHLHLPFVFGAWLSAVRSRLASIPLVVTYHSDLIGGGIRRPTFWAYNKLVNPIVLRQARRIAVTSADHANSSIYGTTIFRERARDIVPVGNGVDTSVFSPNGSSRQLRRDYASEDQIVLLFVSHLDRAHVGKGLFLLLDALALLQDLPLVLVVAGDGNMQATYEQRVLELGLDDMVRFAGRLPHAELPSLYRASDVVVLPSRPPESFGLVLAEGMACGKPVIASDIPGVRELVKNHETGFLIPLSDRDELAGRIRQLAEDGDLRAAMGWKGRQRIEQHYTWRHVGERLLAMYEHVVSEITS